ncbi:MAG: 2-deoxy-D-gluconate 3-dehydrogenase [Porticoccaceae bacterium]|nr:2-deoxy-D-gluconate 3-dehydrogenase [Porticoccaceae bacterium]
MTAPGLDNWLQLAGKTVVITGAAGGIGRAIAQAFGEQGCRLAVLDRDLDALNSLCDRLAAQGVEARSYAVDVCREEQVQTVAGQVRGDFGPISVLVNNAAVLAPGALAELPLEEWNRVLSINLTGYLVCARAFVNQMPSGSAIVHTGSISGHFPQPHSGAYSVAKAGVRMLSELLAVEWGSRGVRSNCVSPAMVRTPMSEEFYRDPAIRRQRESLVPGGRIATPGDIADTVLWLASPRSAYINGEDVVVDGALRRNLLGMIPRPGYDR